MALSTAKTNATESLHCSTFASRYVRTALPRYSAPASERSAARRLSLKLLPESPPDFRCVSGGGGGVCMQVQDPGAVDPQGGGVPDHQRRADAGREPAAEPGVLRHHLDGARVRQAHPVLHQQELRRHGRVPRHHRAPEPVRQHDRAPVQRPDRRRRDGRRRGHRRLLGGHHAGRAGVQEEVAEQDEGGGQALRQAQHRHWSKRPGVLGEVRQVLRGGAQGGEAEGRVLRDGPGEGRGDGGREHHLRRRHPRLHAQRRVRGRQDAQRPAHGQERRDRVGHPDPRGRGERRLHRALHLPGAGVGLPAAAGEEHQRQRPQVRPRLRRRRMGDLEEQGGPPRRAHLPHQLPRRRPAHLHAQLLQRFQPDYCPVLPAHPSRIRGLQGRDAELPRQRDGAPGGHPEHGLLRRGVQGLGRAAGGLLPQGLLQVHGVRGRREPPPLRLDRARLHHARRRRARRRHARRHPRGLQPQPRRAAHRRPRQDHGGHGRARRRQEGTRAGQEVGARHREGGHHLLAEARRQQQEEEQHGVLMPDAASRARLAALAGITFLCHDRARSVLLLPLRFLFSV